MYILYIDNEDKTKSYYTGVYNGFSRKIEDAYKIPEASISKFEQKFSNYKKEKVE